MNLAVSEASSVEQRLSLDAAGAHALYNRLPHDGARRARTAGPQSMMFFS